MAAHARRWQRRTRAEQGMEGGKWRMDGRKKRKRDAILYRGTYQMERARKRKMKTKHSEKEKQPRILIAM